MGAWEEAYPCDLCNVPGLFAWLRTEFRIERLLKNWACRRPTVQLWRERFLALRLAGLEKDAPRPGRIPRIPPEKIQAVVEATLHTTPPNATHWSTRSMAEAQGISEATIRRIWQQHNLKPHLIKTFKLSRDKQFVEKLYDVVGLYLNPPDKSLVCASTRRARFKRSTERSRGYP